MSAHPLLGQDFMKTLPPLRQAGIAGLVDGKLHPDDLPGGAQVSVFYDDMLRTVGAGLPASF